MFDCGAKGRDPPGLEPSKHGKSSSYGGNDVGAKGGAIPSTARCLTARFLTVELKEGTHLDLNRINTASPAPTEANDVGAKGGAILPFNEEGRTSCVGATARHVDMQLREELAESLELTDSGTDRALQALLTFCSRNVFSHGLYLRHHRTTERRKIDDI